MTSDFEFATILVLLTSNTIILLTAITITKFEYKWVLGSKYKYGDRNTGVFDGPDTGDYGLVNPFGI